MKDGNFSSGTAYAEYGKQRHSKPIDEIKDPVEALNWLNGYQDTVLICHNLHLFLDTPEVIQAIQNGIARWKANRLLLW